MGVRRRIAPSGKTTTERGYGYAHQKERKRLTPLVNSGQAYCAQPVCLHRDRAIQPGTRWALGHNETRTAWIGPVHADCNQIDGATRGGRVIAARRRSNSNDSRPNASQNW